MVKKIGPFKIESVLSKSGGMGIVYRASFHNEKKYPERNGRMVALKVARARGPNAAVFEALLRKEIETLNDIRHPGVVRVYPIAERRRYIGRAVEIDPHNAPYYFAMELLTNMNLESITQENRFPLVWRVELIYQIAVILDYLHLRTFAHQDLKPENILFRATPHPTQTPQPVLIDFGLAEKRHYEQSGITAMTLMYAAPERIYNMENSLTTSVGADLIAMDNWALGVIAYELLNRRYPFRDRGSQTTLANTIMNEAPQPMNPDIPPQLANVVFGLLQKDPRSRMRIPEVIQRLETDIELISPRI